MVNNLKVLITGGSSGLGNSLSKELKKKSCKIINVSRSNCEYAETNIISDFNCLEELYLKLKNLDLEKIYDLDLIILNAASIGEITKLANIKSLNSLSIYDFKQV